MSAAEIPEPYSSPPRIKASTPRQLWEGPAYIDRGLLEVSGMKVESIEFDLEGCDDFEITTSSLNDVTFAAEHCATAEVRQSTFNNCDFGSLKFRSLRSASFVDSKLLGTDFSGAVLTDVLFERCILRYANLRRAKLSRVAFSNCTLLDIDAFEASFDDVDFSRSTLTKVNIDRVTANRVDIRTARELGLNAVGRLDGWLAAGHQLPELAAPLALSVGLTVAV
ncbi:MAG: pentapeptide repeat-containing protein [Acidimicrobiales bacterium]